MTITDSSPAGTIPASSTVADAPARRRPASGSPPAPPALPSAPSLRQRFFHRPSRSGWIVAGIALLAALLYSWNLSKVGYANSYYTAAVKSGSVSWKAWFFGAIDPGSFITVDKPPAALWLMGLSARIFGFNTWSMLLPEAAAGVGSVLVLHRMVRRWMGDAAAHLAALALALTPVAVAVFRYNNPDALLTLLCLGGAWALWTALETGRTRWLVLSAALIGLAFETKMLQAFLVLPAFILVYAIAGQPRFWRRIGQLVAALVTLVVSSGWWVAIVAFWPASARPYIGSTTDNSIVSLVLGYNGLSRIFGGSGPGSGGGGAGGAAGGASVGFGGASGWLRMFNVANGGQISWLLPLAGAGLLAGLWLTRRRRRTDLERAGWLLWGGWALVSLVVFSLSTGVFHQYYTVQVAPAVAALAGAGAVTLWKLGRAHAAMRIALPLAVVVTAGWAVVLLARTPDYQPWLRPAIMAGAAVAAGGLWFGDRLRSKGIVLAAAGVAAVTLLAGPAAYAVTTVLHPVSGSLLAAGPSSSGSGFGSGGGGGAGAGGASSTDTALVEYLEAHRGNAKYLVAAFGSQSSASIIIASGDPVITIGGFSGSDPAPTLAQFEQLVASGQVRYVLVSANGGRAGGGPGGGQGGGQGGSSSTSSISSWVTSHGKEVTVTGSTGTVTLYDVSGAA